MKSDRRIVFIALTVVAIAGAWSAREERRSPCASGACRLPLLPPDNTWTTATPPVVVSTNATPQSATSAPCGTPQK